MPIKTLTYFHLYILYTSIKHVFPHVFGGLNISVYAVHVSNIYMYYR